MGIVNDRQKLTLFIQAWSDNLSFGVLIDIFDSFENWVEKDNADNNEDKYTKN